jgi:hypothetical protein
VSEYSKTVAVRNGDEIVIRMPVERLTSILEHAVHHGHHCRDIAILDRDELVEEVLCQINTDTSNGMTATESFFVQSAMFALEDGSTAMRENYASAKAS